MHPHKPRLLVRADFACFAQIGVYGFIWYGYIVRDMYELQRVYLYTRGVYMHGIYDYMCVCCVCKLLAASADYWDAHTHLSAANHTLSPVSWMFFYFMMFQHIDMIC